MLNSDCLMKYLIRIGAFLCMLMSILSMIVSCENAGLDVSDKEPDEELPAEITAGENGKLAFEISSDGSEGDFELVQKSTYVDPDGTEYEYSPKASVSVRIMSDTLAVDNVSDLVSADTLSTIISAEYDEDDMLYTVEQRILIGQQEILLTLQSEEPVLENSLGQTVRLPFLKLGKARLTSVDAVCNAATRVIEITDTVLYDVVVSYEIEAEICNVEESLAKVIPCSATYTGFTSETSLYPGKQFSYFLTDASDNPLNHASSYRVSPGEEFQLNICQNTSYEDNKVKLEELIKAWTSISVADTLEVRNSKEFIEMIAGSVSVQSGFETSVNELPYFVLSEPELVGEIVVDSTDFYPSSAPATRSAAGRILYSKRIQETADDEIEGIPHMKSRAATKGPSEEKYPNVKDFVCPVRVYTARASYRQTATLQNNDEELSLEFCYDVDLAGKTQVEIVDVKYDTNADVGTFPTLMGEFLCNRTTVDRVRVYSTGEILSDSFESVKTMTFVLSVVSVSCQEIFYKKKDEWHEADTLDPKIPTYLEVKNDEPLYLCSIPNFFKYHWSAGLDWDQFRQTGYGEVNFAVGVPEKECVEIDAECYGYDLETDRGDDPQWSTYGRYETYKHSDTREYYDPDKNVSGWYTGYLQSKRMAGSYHWASEKYGRTVYPAKLEISLQVNEKVLCLDDKILAPKQKLDDSDCDYSVEDTVIPEYGSVKLMRLNLDYDVYGYMFQFRLSCILYDYYSPYYEW